MNFLAHIYLSKTDQQIKIGNFIADSVKGKDFSAFPDRVAEGIMLHRYIDTYTDQHPLVKSSKDLIRAEYGHWSGVIVDIYYDHFLATNWDDYHATPLPIYVQEFYELLEENHALLPKKVQNFLPYMIQQDWLTNYATVDGISRIFHQMNNRTRGKSKMNFAPIDLVKYYNELERHFRAFMSDLLIYVDRIYPN